MSCPTTTPATPATAPAPIVRRLRSRSARAWFTAIPEETAGYGVEAK